jgi:hypothetical protein
MKALLSTLAATAFATVAFAQTPAAPAAAEKDMLISSHRLFAKPGQEKALSDALLAHAKKFHKGDVSWRLYDIVSGPDSGGIHLVEGPTTWTAYDDRGDMGKDHMEDYQKTVTPLVEKVSGNSFATFVKDLSTTKATAWTEKVLVMRFVVKPGKGPKAYDYFKAFKPVWEKRGLNVVVWQSAFSGRAGYSVAFRLANGLKELDVDRISNRKAFEEVSGPTEYQRVLDLASEAFDEVSSEIIAVIKDE